MEPSDPVTIFDVEAIIFGLVLLGAALIVVCLSWIQAAAKGRKLGDS